MNFEAEIREIATDVRWIREQAMREAVAREALVGRMDKLDSRQDELESTAKQTRAWAAGVAATLAFLSTLKDWIIPILKGLLATVAIVYLLAGTAGCAYGQTEVQGYWVGGPVNYVVDQDMPATCLSAALEAQKYWEHQGVDYLWPQYTSGDWYGFEACPDTMICVSSEPNLDDGDKDYAGLTWTAVYEAVPYISHAEIKIEEEWCVDALVAIHELGHALGLNHLEAVNNPMHPYTSGIGYLATDEQRAWVRQGSSGGATLSP